MRIRLTNIESYLRAVPAVILALSTTIGASAAMAQGAKVDRIETYQGSEGLPDGIAFQQFLLLLKSNDQNNDRVHELAILASALGKQADENGDFNYLLPRLEQLDRVRDRFQREKVLKSYEVLCPMGRGNRAATNSIAALNAIDGVPISEGQKQFRLYMRSLSKREKAALKDYLTNIKRSTTYIRTYMGVDDSAMARDVTNDIENQCIELENKKLAMGAD